MFVLSIDHLLTLRNDIFSLSDISVFLNIIFGTAMEMALSLGSALATELRSLLRRILRERETQGGKYRGWRTTQSIQQERGTAQDNSQERHEWQDRGEGGENPYRTWRLASVEVTVWTRLSEKGSWWEKAVERKGEDESLQSCRADKCCLKS